MRRRAVFFTLDSLLAVIVVGALTFLIFQQLSSAPSQQNLPLMADGIMSTISADGSLIRSIANSSSLYYELSQAPPAICWQVELVRADGAVLSSQKKAGCSCTGKDSTYSRRPVVFWNGSATTYSIAAGRFCYSA